MGRNVNSMAKTQFRSSYGSEPPILGLLWVGTANSMAKTQFRSSYGSEPPILGLLWVGTANSMARTQFRRGWRVVATLSLGNIILYREWRSFLRDNGVEQGETIVFNKVGVDMFEVVCLDEKECEKSVPSVGYRPAYADPQNFMT
ncbi:B3 domain-containing protein [Striga asiatica]|uniref:B3 domain-containing protein n=1 Tax=Striga asiatica TaxID=4170 RepID=A0A5A7RI40_STRAF|nr:B3 domain-containing protein [Striga asiatica]